MRVAAGLCPLDQSYWQGAAVQILLPHAGRAALLSGQLTGDRRPRDRVIRGPEAVGQLASAPFAWALV